MPSKPAARAWSKGSYASTSSTSTRSHGSSRSSQTEYTNITSYSYSNPTQKHHDTCEEHEVFDQLSIHDNQAHVDPRASTETYASSVTSLKEPSRRPSLCPLQRRVCYQADAIAATPPEFGELFPSTRRLLIQHDDTTLDGNLNLRVDTEVTISKGQKVKVTLFHLRMYDLAERQFSLRRYHRQSGREVCNSKRKYVKPTSRPIAPPRKHSLSAAFNKMTFKTLTGKPRAKVLPGLQCEESDDEYDLCAAQKNVEATIPTDTIRFEFSNYAQVELRRSKRSEGNRYDFEYWGERYSWRRIAYQDGSELVFSLELVNLATGACIAHITPDRLSPRQRRQEVAQGGWVPPCSMRILEKQISSDLGDVIMATGLVALTDDCIRRTWSEPHRLSLTGDTSIPITVPSN